jgi:hypothetical protein
MQLFDQLRFIEEDSILHKVYKTKNVSVNASENFVSYDETHQTYVMDQ